MMHRLLAQRGMVEKRIKNTDPVVQVCLCVVKGNFYVICKKDQPSGGFCVIRLGMFTN